MRLSHQALGALMMALQKSLIEQSDIVPVLQDFEFQVNDNEQLTVLNPPVFKMDQVSIEEEINERQNIMARETKATTGSD
tara:strand:+ start:207 stop:446 length:240 start_codon:yes stop_codon:yes gene_type:complete